MPRSSTVTLSKQQQARVYARENKLPYDVAYHLMIAANNADGVAPRGIDPNAPAESDLTTEQAAQLAAAKSALSL
jgi:hypothetical protein